MKIILALTIYFSEQLKKNLKLPKIYYILNVLYSEFNISTSKTLKNFEKPDPIISIHAFFDKNICYKPCLIKCYFPIARHIIFDILSDMFWKSFECYPPYLCSILFILTVFLNFFQKKLLVIMFIYCIYFISVIIFY